VVALEPVTSHHRDDDFHDVIYHHHYHRYQQQEQHCAAQLLECSAWESVSTAPGNCSHTPTCNYSRHFAQSVNQTLHY